jgi:DUF2959 family protein
MKVHNRPTAETLIRFSSFACLMLVLVGCASPGYKKSNAAAVSLQDAAAEVQAESRSLDLTMGALRDLVNDPAGDLRQPYQHFSSSLNRLEATARKTDSSGRRMAERSSAYLAAWDKEAETIEYQHVRDLSQSRKSEVANRFDAVQRRYQESQAAVQPLIDYLEDIRKALGSDLTSAGIESLKSVAQNADANAAKVQIALAALTAALNDSGASISSLAFQHTNAQAIP